MHVRAVHLFGAAVLLCAALAAVPRVAEACGCFSPPIPTPDDLNYAVNQESELIIFEVGETTVTAHVLIRYQGNPKNFAWIVPVPNAPILDLSHEFAFAFLDEQTRPVISDEAFNLCPQPEYECNYHARCPPPRSSTDSGPSYDGAPFPQDASSADSGAMPPPVEILGRETIGSYETITFAAGDAAAAVTWLQTQGFIVNASSAPFMQPYADAGMAFVAAKLVAGAEVDQIRPLKMTFEATAPMIPLRLTAVGTQPELTVTAFIYGDSYFNVEGHPLIEASDLALGLDPDGRDNYPMALSRAIDEAGGDAFLVEAATPPVAFFDSTGCCGSADDWCSVGNNERCECPGDEFDAADCEREGPGVTLLAELAANYTHMTRITTRLNAEEMTFDPMFVPRDPREFMGSPRLSLNATRRSLDECRDEIVGEGRARYEELRAAQFCNTTYCGHGECVTINHRTPACACEDGFVGRSFTNLDGLPSVTCVPDEYPVDFSLGGLTLPNACAAYDCGAGACLDLGGFPTCQCNEGAAAALDDEGQVFCRAVQISTGGPGADPVDDRRMADLDVCWPMPPVCRTGGWLQRTTAINRGVACGDNEPPPSRLLVPPAPRCDSTPFDGGPNFDGGPGYDGGTSGVSGGGCGGCASGGSGAGGGSALFWMVALFVMARRRR